MERVRRRKSPREFECFRESGASVSAANGVVTRLIDKIRPGLPVRDLARRGRELLDATGTVEDPTSETFPILGHGNSLFGEPPTILLNAEDGVGYEPLFEGQVLGIETFLSDS